MRGRGLARGAAALLALAAAGTALAQVRVRVEIPYGASVGVASYGGASAGEATFVTGLHVDAEADLDPVRLTVRLDPSLTATDPASVLPPNPLAQSSPSWEAGLTEAYALLREGPVDLSAGLERLPLETARLTVPYQLDRTAKDGQRQGVWGARASLYLTPVRLRGAFLERDGSLGGALSLRADLTSAQLEANAVYLDGLALGAGASGTLGDTVLYGEAWLLSDPWRGRGAVGASGYLSDALWTLEAAFAPPLALPEAAAAPQLAGQVNVPLQGDNSLELYAGLSLPESVLTPGSRSLAAQASATWLTRDPYTAF
ncbi:MAG: hypothetical protein P8Y13_03225 [Deinococcales bacterium]